MTAILCILELKFCVALVGLLLCKKDLVLYEHLQQEEEEINYQGQNRRNCLYVMERRGDDGNGKGVKRMEESFEQFRKGKKNETKRKGKGKRKV